MALGVPLAVLASATGPYDDPKAWALPILASVTGLAWLASARPEAARAPSSSDRRVLALRLIILACVSWWAITTVTSIAPLLSLLGSFGRGMGWLTIASAALLFFVIQSECRTPRAVRSLVDVALLGSVPVGLLALGQAAGWDPLPQGWDPAVKSLTIRSTFGTHIFLGSYLVALIPLAAGRLEWACRNWLESGRWAPPTRVQWLHAVAGTVWVAGAVALIALASHWSIVWWALVPWGIVGAAMWMLYIDRLETGADTALTALLLSGLLAGHVFVVIVSRARGAFIGMLVGVSVAGFAFLVRRRAWKTLTSAALGLVGLAVFLVLLNLPGSPVASLGKVGLLSRLGEIGNVEHGTPGWVRLQVWRGIVGGWRRQLGGEELVPGVSPRVRSLIGYGQETQLIVLDPLTSSLLGVLPASGEGWRARYVFDRAHNILLDHLVTEGLVGAALWVLLVGSLLAVGIGRLRDSVAPGEMAIRLGALGAMLGHLADGQVGIATPMPLALFWLAAALLTSESWLRAPVAPSPDPRRMTPGKPWRMTVLSVAALLAILIAWTSTRWLLASVAYAEGARHGIAGRLVDAYGDFRRSLALMPWLPLPAEAAAYTALRLAGRETELSRRLELLDEADAALAESRRHAMSGAASWALAAQVTFAEARAGQPGKLAESLLAFATVERLRPGDPQLLAQWGWAWLESGDSVRARQTARQALSRDPLEWLAWAVLARSSRNLGDLAEAERAAGKARALAPHEASRFLGAM